MVIRLKAAKAPTVVMSIWTPLSHILMLLHPTAAARRGRAGAAARRRSPRPAPHAPAARAEPGPRGGAARGRRAPGLPAGMARATAARSGAAPPCARGGERGASRGASPAPPGPRQPRGAAGAGGSGGRAARGGVQGGGHRETSPRRGRSRGGLRGAMCWGETRGGDSSGPALPRRREPLPPPGHRSERHPNTCVPGGDTAAMPRAPPRQKIHLPHPARLPARGSRVHHLSECPSRAGGPETDIRPGGVSHIMLLIVCLQ